MSVQSYIEDLRKEKNVSFRQLAQDSGIAYQTLLALKSGKVNDLSKKILTKLAAYENIAMEELLFKIKLDPAITNICNENTLFYLCKKITEDYKVQIDQEEVSPFSKPYHYAGTYEKRTGNCLSYVEDWESLKHDHWKELCKPHNFHSYDQYYLTYFKSKEAYYVSVLSFGFLRISCIADKNIVNYDLIFSNKEEKEMVETLLPAKSKIHMNAIYQPISKGMASGYVPEIFLSDIKETCDEILKKEKNMLIDQQNLIKKKLYEVLKILFNSKTCINTYKNAEQMFTLQKLFNTFFSDKQSLINFIDGKIHDIDINLIDSITVQQQINILYYTLFTCCKTIKKNEYVNVLILLNSI